MYGASACSGSGTSCGYLLSCQIYPVTYSGAAKSSGRELQEMATASFVSQIFLPDGFFPRSFSLHFRPGS